MRNKNAFKETKFDGHPHFRCEACCFWMYQGVVESNGPIAIGSPQAQLAGKKVGVCKRLPIAAQKIDCDVCGEFIPRQEAAKTIYDVIALGLDVDDEEDDDPIG